MKRVAEIVLARAGPAAVCATFHRPLGVVLAYHNVVPHGESVAGDASLHVDQAEFGRQLDALADRADVVPLDEVVGPADAGNHRPRVAITFDDAYRGTMTAGAEELAARGMPATVFVPPGLLGTDGFWWDRLAPGRGALPVAVRDRALGAEGGDQERVLAWARAEGLSIVDLPEHARPVTEAELLDEACPAGIRFGAHTWSHPNLAVASPERVDAELSRSRDWLRSRTDRYVDWLAYPYGLRTQRVVEQAAERFDGALLVEGGATVRGGRPTGARHETPRVNVPRGMTVDGVLLRVSGLL